MKHFIFFMFLQIIFTIYSESAKSNREKIYSTSPIGPYKLLLKQTYSLKPTKNLIQHDLYLSHKDNKTVIFGNTTSVIPFDDTLFFEIRMALKDSSGRWNENSFMQKWPKACSTTKKLAGNAWTKLMYGIGVNNTNCPIPPGFYIAPGVDISISKDSNLPQTFLYGTYKFYFYYTRQNEILGGQVNIIELKRP
uniref:Uncharacterized protein n=1 Tax=Schizaphis graminum TaxID=13262 RepID=A0A2S2PPQ3_SCHGA